MTAIPTTMSAAILTGHGGYDKLEIHHDWPVPTPQAGEVLIKVSACGINSTDINTRIGWYDDSVEGDSSSQAADGFDNVADDSVAGWGNTGIQFPRIQGADPCGRVAALGDGVPQDWLGSRVITDNWLRDWNEPMNLDKTGYYGSERDGGFAQYTTMPILNVGRINSDWTDAELATLSCSYNTAEGMLERSSVTEKDTVLITGASGGVGSALVQLARRRGAKIIALTSASKADQVAALDPDAIIRRGQDDWRNVIRSVNGTDKVTVSADVVGGPVFADLMSVLARGGRYVTSGAIGGKKVELDISHLYLFDWSLLGSTINEPYVFRNLLKYVENNEIKPLLAGTYPLEKIHEAQAAFLEKKHVGKLVITLPK